MMNITASGPLVGPLIVVASAAICAALIVGLRPLLARHALAKPNIRSSHREPTPQGGGIAVTTATVAVAAIAIFLFSENTAAVGPHVWMVFAATIFIAIVGMADDIRSISYGPRLFLQIVAVSIVITSLPDKFVLFPFLPWWLERALLLLGGLWFVNLVNFMDGLDWMTVAETVPICAALALLGWLGALPADAVVVALALFGAMLGFAPFNRPVAKLFLGDVGSLPIGLLLGWLLLLLAANGHLAAAILLPLYYLADATITLIRRAVNREPIWHAHRTHFYQRATDRGFSVMDVVSRVFAVNIALAALATVAVRGDALPASGAALTVGCALVGWLLAAFARGKKRTRARSVQAASPRKSGTASRNTR
jgi:UDP-N-acetylmuramyl pentapeptide phosphotransferase/UDP-N-acetylglucosamine-1-phosphate transferase